MYGCGQPLTANDGEEPNTGKVVGADTYHPNFVGASG